VDPRTIRALGVLLTVALTMVPGVDAGDVAVRYLAERASLRSVSPDAPVTVELHADGACSLPVAMETLTLRTLGSIVEVKRIALRGGSSRPRTVELRHVMREVPAARSLYARVRGDGVAPVGSPCQVQAFAPPPAAARPIARDAEGTAIGVLSVMSYPSSHRDVQTAVLRDDGHGVYGLAIGRQAFVAFESGFGWSTSDCSGTPYSGTVGGVLAPATWDEASDVIYGPAGPAAIVPIRAFSDYYGCHAHAEEPALATPVAPLGLERFVPPFGIDHAPPEP
jgi:hypothetical protein